MCISMLLPYLLDNLLFFFFFNKKDLHSSAFYHPFTTLISVIQLDYCRKHDQIRREPFCTASDASKGCKLSMDLLTVFCSASDVTPPTS